MPAPNYCLISGVAYQPALGPTGPVIAPAASLWIRPVSITGQVIQTAGYNAPADDTTAMVSFRAVQGSQINLRGEILGFDHDNHPNGVNYTVPLAATANLEDVISTTLVPTAGLTVYNEAVALPGLYGAFDFAGAGVDVTQPSAGRALVTIAGGAGLPVADTQTIVKGSGDPTKLLRFEVDGFTTATTRVATWPNKDGTVAFLDDIAGGGTWGSITGTLSAQTDLQSALNAKQAAFGNQSANQVYAGPATGAAAAPAFRSLVALDIPALAYEPVNANIQSHISSTSNPHSVTKTQVGLGSVENTALSTWAGSINITTLGTIVTGSIPHTLLTGLGSGIGTFLGTPSSANLRAALTDENGTGAALFDGATSPTFITPTIASFANATHTHADAAGGGTISAANLTGTLADARLSANVPLLDRTPQTFSGTVNIFQQVGLSGTTPTARRPVNLVVTGVDQTALGGDYFGANINLSGGGGTAGEHLTGIAVVSIATANMPNTGGPIGINIGSTVNAGVTTSQVQAIVQTTTINGTGNSVWGTYDQIVVNTGGSIPVAAIGAFHDVVAVGTGVIEAAVGGHYQIRGVTGGTVTSTATGVKISGWDFTASTPPITSYGLYLDASIDVGTSNKYAIFSQSTSESLLTGPLVVNNSITGTIVAGTTQVKAGGAAPVLASLGVAANMVASADGAIGVQENTLTVAPTGTSIRTWHGISLVATMNGSGTGTKTVNLINVDTVNTSLTGIVTNLLKASFGGSQKLLLESSGDLTVSGLLKLGSGPTTINNAAGQILAAAAATPTGSGNWVLATSPTLVTPALGTPSALVLTNATGLPPTTGIVGWPANASGVLTNNGSGTLSWAAAGAGDMVLASVQTVTGAKTFGTIGGAVGKLILAGATSGSTILNAAAIAGTTTLTLPGSTDTLVGLATTDTLTNKTLTTPTIASFANATHNHTNAAGGGQITPAALSSFVGLPVEICVAVSDETTDLTTGTAKLTFRMPYAMTVTEVRANVNTAPTGATIIVDIKESGTTILSTKISIDASEKTSETAAAAPVISDSALADDAELTINLDQVGSSVPGKGLKIWLIGVRA